MTNNEGRSPGPLRIGVIADVEGLALLTPGLHGCVLLQPHAQSGMPQTAGLRDVPWFDDPRVLLGNPELEAVLLATNTRQDAALSAVVIAQLESPVGELGIPPNAVQ